jgi:hypothetical protein
MRKTAVILRFNPCSRLCSHLGISLCLFEFCRTVARSVVLLEDFHGSARWDVLPVGKEVKLYLVSGSIKLTSIPRRLCTSIISVLIWKCALYAHNLTLHDYILIF